MLRVMTYNIHHGGGNDQAVDLQRIADVVRAESPDIVAMQELDRFWARSGGTDQPDELARLLGMNVCYGANLVDGPNEHADVDHEYGVATFTAFPVLRHENHPLPVVDGWEKRGLLETRVDVPGVGEVAILNTHLQSDGRGGLEIARSQRRAQAEWIVRYIETIDVLFILMGDFNAEVESGDIDALSGMSNAWSSVGEGSGRTYPARPDGEPEIRIDHIFASGHFRVESAKVLINATTRMASDHFPLVADIASTASRL